jgi:hypothetical protein
MNRKLLVLVTSMVLAACDVQSDPGFPLESVVSEGLPITVLTRNLYLGADLNPVIGAPSPQAIPVLAAAAWTHIQAMDYPRRAGLLAAEIAATRPQLIGLQEAVSFHIQQPGDAALGGRTPATQLVYDYTQILLDSLAARGLSYRMVARTVGTQVEVPIYTGRSPVPFDDLLFTDSEVILADEGVEVSNPRGAVFGARLSFPLGGPGGPQLDAYRGWASVDVSQEGRTFRFISTHLEVQRFAPIQVAQAREMIAIADASPYPVILLGDFNSSADGSQTPSYQMIADAGYLDIWGERPNGLTCCHAEDLSNHLAAFDQRLDVIFTKGFADFAAPAQVVGNHPGDRRGTNLWPSDHAGVFTRLLLQ